MYSNEEVSQKIELYLTGRNLKDLDMFSKSDPYCRILFKKNYNTNLEKIGQTQTIENNLNPDWKRSFVLDYIFEATQNITFEVMDEDEKVNDELIGKVDTTLGAIVGARNQTSVFTLKNHEGKDCGKLVVRCEKVQQSNLSLQMKWKGVKLMNTDSWFDWWDKSDPYLKFFKIRPDNTYLLVHETEVLNNDLNPNWKPFMLPLPKLVSSTSSKFKVQCWDKQEDINKHQFIGEVVINLDELKLQNGQIQYNMVNKKAKNPGRLVLESFKIVVTPTFIDYLRGNLQINMICAIDFTGSNGVPTAPQSLHYLNPKQPNQYQTTLKQIWAILQHYDYDKLIPSFAFGAKPHFPNLNSSLVNHCFPLSGNPNHIEIGGFDQLMEVYTNALKFVQFAGPTYFGPILKQVIKIAEVAKMEGSNSYQVLVILTDGEIHDMALTTDLIVCASQLPLSIIIVGVGNADFGNMEALDGDNGLYDSKGRKCQRDIVQFVPFRSMSNPQQLTTQLLRELPSQVVQYMGIIGKAPNPPQQVDINKLVQINPATLGANLLNQVNQKI